MTPTRKRWLLLGVVATIIGLFLGIGVRRSISDSIPSHASLVAVAGKADRVVIRPTCMLEKTKYDVAPFEIQGPATIKDLLEQVQLIPDPFTKTRCGCDGDYHLDFYKGEECLVSLGWHHGRRIRWRRGPWDTDVTLTDDSRKNVPAWLKKHGFAAMQNQIDDGYMIDN